MTTTITRPVRRGQSAQSPDAGLRTALLVVALGVWGLALPMTLVSSLAPLGA